MRLSSRRPLVTAALAAISACTLALGGLAVAGEQQQAAAQEAAAPAPTPDPGSGGIRVAYFDQWSIYSNHYYLKDVDKIADNLDFLIYDFENIHPQNLTCFEATKASNSGPGGESDPNAGDGAGDQFADYQKSFGADISVDGTADKWGQPIAGNFHQLQELKKRHPNLKVLLSIGGWTYSKYFSDAAATDASRQKLVNSCMDMFIKGNLPEAGGYGGPGTAAGIFDGFDIDWEYPASDAGHLGNHHSTADTANFTKLLAEFRGQLDTFGAANDRQMYLAAALPGGQDKIAKIQTDKVGQYLNFADIMTYDMHGAWDATGPTNFQDPLYESPDDPSPVIPPGDEHYTIDNVIDAYTNGDATYGIPGGFPANKMTLGIPFYYRGWTGVSAGDTHGLYQPATGPSPGHPKSGNVPGIAMYKEIKNTVTNPAYTYFDPVTKSAYFYDGTTFYAGESAKSIQARTAYLHEKGLAGVMMFSLYDLDQQNTLFNEVVTDLQCSDCGGSEPPTTTPPTTTPPTTTTPPPTGHCSAAAWEPDKSYSGGDSVSYNGDTWTAKWWNYNATPGSAGVWVDNGPCNG